MVSLTGTRHVEFHRLEAVRFHAHAVCRPGRQRALSRAAKVVHRARVRAVNEHAGVARRDQQAQEPFWFLSSAPIRWHGRQALGEE